MAARSIPKTTTSTPDTVGAYAARVAEICGTAFQDAPPTRRFIAEIDNITTRPTPEPSVSRVQKHFMDLIGGKDVTFEIIEAGDWAACALWEPPVQVEAKKAGEDEAMRNDNDNDNQSDANTGPSRKQVGPARTEYFTKIRKVRERVLPDGRFWHLAIVARAAGRTEPGVVRAVLEPNIQRAQREGIPICLEASSAHARDVYLHFGFELVEEFTISVGEANAQGDLIEGGNGEGITTWAMVRWPTDTGAKQM